MKFKQKYTEEKAKIKSLKGKERKDYIIDYYKYHILVAILLVILIIYVLYTFLKPKTEVSLACGIINQSVDEDWLDEYEQEINDALGFTDSTCDFDASYDYNADGSGNSYNAASLGKMSVNMQEGLIDILIVEQDFVDHYQDLDKLCDLQSVLPQDMYSELGDKLYTQTTQYGDSFACAIDITGTDIANEVNSDKTLYLCVVYSTEHEDNIVSYVEYLFR